MKRILFFIAGLLLIATSCQNFDDLEANPNLASEASVVPPSYLLGRITYELYQGGGVTDGISGRVFEGPFDQIHRWNQFIVSNDSYYGGDNAYSWSNTATAYNLLKLVNKMELQAAKSLNPDLNAYKALGKFFRAYTYIWLSQRVGDIPTEEAGKGLNNLSPKYTLQKDVYAQALQLLEDANTDIASLIPTITTATNIGGDIYYNNDLKKWQKLVNTYKLRVLISLSKRADDTPDLGIKQKFADIINNPAKYPIMTGNSDNLQFVFNAAYNPYPLGPTSYYNRNQNVGLAFINLLKKNTDPRLFVLTTPAPGLVKAGKSPLDTSAYAGSSIAKTLSQLAADKASDVVNSPYSFINYSRYFQSFTGPEAAILIGYPEMCFNIAEAANRGWISADATLHYTNGIKASLSFYDITEGKKVSISDPDKNATNPAIATLAVNTFLGSTAYKGNNNDGLQQILEQKYIAFWNNSGWEAYYNWRRTGFPSAFVSTGVGINGVGKVPMRWQYPVDETTFNAANASDAIQRQFGGTDDLYKMMWLIK
jgi:hypothetical protein